MPPESSATLKQRIMNSQGIVRRRDLPHIDVEGKPFFITACLAGSIPANGLKRIREYRSELESRVRPEKHDPNQWASRKHKLVFKLVDSLLDGAPAATHLRDPRLASIVQNAIFYFATQRYRLFAFVIMPSHYHWVFLPDPQWSLQFAYEKKRTPREAISHSIQSYTANRCNRILGKSGTFWQGETYDHYARDEAELSRIVHYVEQNPVVAGLVSDASDFQWSSARLRKQLGLGPIDPISPNDLTH